MIRPQLHRFRRRERREAAIWMAAGFLLGFGLLAIAYAEHLHKLEGMTP